MADARPAKGVLEFQITDATPSTPLDSYQPAPKPGVELKIGETIHLQGPDRSKETLGYALPSKGGKARHEATFRA